MRQGVVMARNNGNRPADQVVEARETEAWRLRCLGWTQAKIGKKLGVTNAAVSLMLKRIVNKAVLDMEYEVKKEMLTQATQLRHIVSESLDAWENSKIGTKRISKTITGINKPNSKDNSLEAENIITKQDLLENGGNPQFLRTAMEAMGDIRTLFHMDVTQVKLVDWEQYVPDGYDSDAIADRFAELMIEGSTVNEEK